MPTIDIQIAQPELTCPEEENLRSWASAALPENRSSSELCIRIVDEPESQALNRKYRQKDYPTNVLSFPATILELEEIELLGDIVICAPVVAREALEQNKTKTAHWAHMVVHGILHLLGYDHEEPEEADQMESMEIVILQSLGFGNPYEI